MTDSDALHRMLVYALHEATALGHTRVAELLLPAIGELSACKAAGVKKFSVYDGTSSDDARAANLQ